MPTSFKLKSTPTNWTLLLLGMGVTLFVVAMIAGLRDTASASSKVWNLEVYVMNADGSDQRNLTQYPSSDDYHPVWSPDGKEIAFLSDRDRGIQIYLMGPDGEAVRRLTGLDERAGFAWSPDGKKIAFTSIVGLNIVSSDAKSHTQLVSGIDFSITLAAWSPDSKRIAFSGRPYAVEVPKETLVLQEDWERGKPRHNTYAINLDGTAFTKIGNPGRLAWAALPSWSPDGRWIASNTAYGFPSIAPPSGGNPVLLGYKGAGSKSLGQVFPGSTLLWSSDSKKLVFGGAGNTIYAISVGTGDVTPIAAGSSPALAPDGNKIAFVRDGTVYVKEVQGGTETALAQGGDPAWSPDGKKIAFVRAVIMQPPSPQGSWVSRSLAPSIQTNSSLVWDGGNYIYAYSGNRDRDGTGLRVPKYYRYSISEDSWVPLRSIPDDNPVPDSQLVVVTGDLYTITSNQGTAEDIWRYDGASGSWIRVKPFPSRQNQKGTYAASVVRGVVVAKGDKYYMYVHDGPSLKRYSITDRAWETVAEGYWAPPTPDAMVWTGGDSIYGFTTSREPGGRSFWRYAISANQWSTLSLPPGQAVAVEHVHLSWGAGDYIYLYGRAGRTTPQLWRYSLVGDSWEGLEPLPVEEISSLVATSDGIYVAVGGEYSKTLGAAPSAFYFAPSPAPISTPGLSPELRKVSVHLYGQITQVSVSEDIVLGLSAVNLIGNPTMVVQLVLQVPPGMSITAAQFVDGGGGQYTATYEVQPGYIRQAEVHVRPNQEGRFNIVGYVAYYLQGDKATVEYRAVTLPVTVGASGSATRGMPSGSGSSSGRLNVWMIAGPILGAIGSMLVIGLAVAKLRSGRHPGSSIGPR